MDEAPASKELELFNKLATAIGDTLETVCNMQERERTELITVLGLVSEEETVKIIRPSEQQVEPEFEESSESSSGDKGSARQDSLSVEKDGMVKNNCLDDLDDDLKVVAIKKRKRSPSGEVSIDRKRKLSVENSKSDKVDFSKYAETKNGNSVSQVNSSGDNSNSAGAESSVSKDGISKRRTSADISKIDFNKFLETEDGDIFKDVEKNKENGDAELSLDDQSVSLLGEPSKPRTSRFSEAVEEEMLSSSPVIGHKVGRNTKKPRLSFKDIEAELYASDEEPSNSEVNMGNSEEMIVEKEVHSESLFNQKISEINRIISSRLCVDDKVKKRVSSIFDRRIRDPALVLSQDSLPNVQPGFVEAFRKTPLEDKERMKPLLSYFKELNNIKSKGLVHGASPVDVSWTTLLPRRNTRVKTEEKGIIMKFSSTEETVETETFDDSSSDEFEKNTFRGVKKKDDFDAIKNQTKPSRDTTPRLKEPQSSGWMSKPSSGVKNDSTSNISKLSRRKRIFPLRTPEKSSDLQILPSSSTSDGSLGTPLHKGGNHSRGFGSKTNPVDTSLSDDDSVEIVLEVASKENTPSKPMMKTKTMSINSPGVPSMDSVSPELVPDSGTCPMCDKEMSMDLLMTHSASCEGPDQGPSLRNTGGRGRMTY